jgi:hypothetical protein
VVLKYLNAEILVLAHSSDLAKEVESLLLLLGQEITRRHRYLLLTYAVAP